MFRFIVVALLGLATQVSAKPAALDGPAILERATEAAGGEGWAQAETIILEGRAEFWGPTGEEPRSTADSYIMYREFDLSRTAAHRADGKVRIIVSDKGRPLWTVGFDGQTSWTEKGVIPQAEADAFWANNMGYGIIRYARKPGFTAERVADRVEGAHPIYLVRLTDPIGGVTLFGIDQKSYAIRTMGFMTPRGWHERHYDDFIRLKNPDWLQPRTVTLDYNGVKANTLYWKTVRVNAKIDPAVFSPPAELNAAK
jgi:hypothetical protein